MRPENRLTIAALCVAAVLGATAPVWAAPTRVFAFIIRAPRMGESFTDEEIRLLAQRFDLVVVDQGQWAPTADEVFSRANAIRQKAGERPIKIITYTSPFALSTDDLDWPQIDANEDFFLHEQGGERAQRRGRMMLSDPTNHRWSSFFGDLVTQRIVQYGYDGVFIDNLRSRAMAQNPNRLPADLLREWRSHTMGFVDRVRARLPEDALIIGNPLTELETDGNLPILQHVDGVMMENFAHGYQPIINWLPPQKWQRNLEIIARAVPTGKLILVNSNIQALPTDTPEMVEQLHSFCLASYHLISAENTLFGFNYSHQRPYRGLQAFPEWDWDLGKPTDTYQVVDDVYIRYFSDGAAVVNPGPSDKSIVLERQLCDPLGRPITHLDMPPYTGMLLRNV